jgi:hypothetical protein
MTAATEQLTKVEDRILEALSTIQKPVLDAVRSLAERADGRIPEVPRPEAVPPVDELVLARYDFAERLLANQRAFTTALFEALKPSTPASKPTTKPKAAKAA